MANHLTDLQNSISCQSNLPDPHAVPCKVLLDISHTDEGITEDVLSAELSAEIENGSQAVGSCRPHFNWMSGFSLGFNFYRAYSWVYASLDFVIYIV